MRSAVITGNTLHYAPKHDILIEQSSQVVLSDNVFDRHPRYNYTDEIRQGIVFRESTDCTLSGMHINGGTAPAAFAIHGGQRFHISNCTILDVAHVGLLLENVSGCFVHRNMIDMGDATRTGIRVTGGKANLVRDNGPTKLIASVPRPAGRRLVDPRARLSPASAAARARVG